MKLDIQYLFTAKYAKWIIISLISILSLLIVYAWVSLYWLTPQMATPTEENASLQMRNKQGLIDNILKSSLFGEYVPNDLNAVKKSMLNVTLVGILLGGSKEQSQVIIGSAGGDELNYKVGDTIPGGAIIKKITADGVLVERNGTLESLSLPKNDLTFEPLAKPLKEE